MTSEDVEQRKINFVFENNTAECTGFGNSIHVSTVLPCNITYKGNTDNSYCISTFSKTCIFNCVANFIFLGGTTEVSTDAKAITATAKDSPILAIPGIELFLPIHVVDELNNSITGVYSVLILNGNVTLDPAYQYITENRSKLYGQPGDKATLHLQVKSTRNVELQLEVTLSQCPPGYVLDEGACKCSIYLNDTEKYTCVIECNELSNKALIDQNWWMNFDNKAFDENNDVIYGYCPKDHCTTSKGLTRFINIILSETDGSEVDVKFLCHPTRTGRLCSQCRDNYTAHYHSNTFKCGSKDTCKWGWLLYIVSELLPVTCLFLIIILFDIKLTSGAVSGLIYFAQITDKIILDEVATQLFQHFDIHTNLNKGVCLDNSNV